MEVLNMDNNSKWLVIYDYIGEDSMDTCYGIKEEVNSYNEAIQLKNELKENPNYCNIQITGYYVD
jgi:hypothetical protein